MRSPSGCETTDTTFYMKTDIHMPADQIAMDYFVKIQIE